MQLQGSSQSPPPTQQCTQQHDHDEQHDVNVQHGLLSPPSKNHHTYAPFGVALVHVQSIPASTPGEWYAWANQGKLPAYIPLHPDKVYTEWQGWDRWLAKPDAATATIQQELPNGTSAARRHSNIRLDPEPDSGSESDAASSMQPPRPSQRSPGGPRDSPCPRSSEGEGSNTEDESCARALPTQSVFYHAHSIHNTLN